MAQDSASNMIRPNQTVRIGPSDGFYSGTIAHVLSDGPFHTATVKMFNGKVYTMSSRNGVTDMIQYTVARTADVPANLMRDINSQGKEWAIVRKSETSESVWSFHTTEKTAQAAKRRWQSRDIVTR